MNMAAITATQIADELNISRSYLYLLRKNGVFTLENNKWDTSVIDTVRNYMESLAPKKVEEKAPEYKITKINNRRYLGNKYKLLSFINEVVENNCSGINTVADIFAGTGAVASAFLDKKIITNDTMYSNYICHIAWFSPETFSEDKIISLITRYNALTVDEDNYMTENFSDTYFSRVDCSKIGYIREDIEQQYANGTINNRERAILITSLLYAMDKIANTCGRYDAYRQGVEFDRHLELAFPTPKQNRRKNQCYNENAKVW